MISQYTKIQKRYRKKRLDQIFEKYTDTPLKKKTLYKHMKT